MDRTLSERMWMVRLIEAYGRLLTAHQQRVLRLYYLDDLSLGEIAERLHVTRQAVFDGLRRSGRELRRVEAWTLVRGCWSKRCGSPRRISSLISDAVTGPWAWWRRRWHRRDGPSSSMSMHARWSWQRRTRSSTAWAMSKCCRATGADRSP